MYCFISLIRNNNNKKNPASLGKRVDRNKQKRNKQVNEVLGKKDRKIGVEDKYL